MQHPDKAGSDPISTKKFQALSFVHSVLSDKTKRAEYDRTGSFMGLDDDSAMDSESFDAWQQYWRSMFPVVTEEQIETVLSEYRGSTDEKNDVLKWYVQCEGDMDEMLDSIIGAREEDVDRYVAIVQQALQSGAVKPFAIFTKVYGTSEKPPSKKGSAVASAARSARASKAAKEAAEAEAMLAEMQAAHVKKHGGGAGGGKPSLMDMLAARQQSREDAFSSAIASLEARYGGAGGSGKAAGSKRLALDDSKAGGSPSKKGKKK